jgi:hypothetical protein
MLQIRFNGANAELDELPAHRTVEVRPVVDPER